jgi:hypothetical protein
MNQIITNFVEVNQCKQVNIYYRSQTLGIFYNDLYQHYFYMHNGFIF